MIRDLDFGREIKLKYTNPEHRNVYLISIVQADCDQQD